jgi:hypothetical protein
VAEIPGSRAISSGNRRVPGPSGSGFQPVQDDFDRKSPRTQWVLAQIRSKRAQICRKSAQTRWKPAWIRTKSFWTRSKSVDFHRVQRWIRLEIDADLLEIAADPVQIGSCRGVLAAGWNRRLTGWTTSGTDPPSAWTCETVADPQQHWPLPERRNTMAVKGFGFGSRVSRWDVTLTNAKEEKDVDLSAAKDDLSSLESFHGEARGLLSRGEDLRSQLRENTARLREVTKQGDVVRRRVGAILRGKLGFTSEKLIKFGFKPAVVNRRRKAAEKPMPEGGEGTAQAAGKKPAG